MLDVTNGWIEQYFSALVLLNVLLGQPAATTPLEKHPAPDSMVRTLNEIARGLYRPARYFSPGEARHHFAHEQRELVPTEQYTVVLLNASTSVTDFASVDTGGILFEDPAWAIFAAEGLSHQPGLAIPLATNHAELAKRLALLESAVKSKHYKAHDFFGPVTRFQNPPVASFSFLQITGAQLDALRKEGIATFGRPTPKMYVLFDPPPPPR